MQIKTFEIFKPGTHTTMGGETIGFTYADIESAAQAFSETVRAAPLVLGHPTHDGPALGWVKRLMVNGQGLYATASFGEELVEHVKKKRYPAVSAAWLKPNDARNPRPGRWYLKHVGFLGAIAPAVKGLEPVTFAEFSWDGAESIPLVDPYFNIAREMAVAFAETQATGQNVEDHERQIHHKFMQLLMKRTPGMSVATAAHAAYRAIEDHKAMKSAGDGMDVNRVAFHEKIIDLQAASPGLPYAAAAHRLMNSR